LKYIDKRVFFCILAFVILAELMPHYPPLPDGADKSTPANSINPREV